MKTRKKLLAGAVGGLGLMGAAPAHADTITVLFSPPVNSVNGNYVYDYKAEISSSGQMFTGDFFTVYDVGGFVSASDISGYGGVFDVLTTASGTGIADGGVTPAALSTTDDPNLLNVTYRYTGSAPIVGYTNLLFSLVSTSDYTVLDSFVGRDHKKSNPLLTNTNYGSVAVPGGVAIPNPASVWGGAGLLAVLGASYFKRRRNRLG